MITRQNQTKLQQSQNFDSHSFGIKQEGISHIFNVLRNQLYSDKVLAVIREYSTNAVDAHTEVGKDDLPIEVSLPTVLKAEFKVRDYGRGLTDEQIAQIYAMYGESTKRGTNDQIGQLGLGSKSAFAYGDNFIINSFVDGTKTSYNAFIDPSQVGRISKLSSEKTEEKSGIEIVIAVKQDDIEEFYSKAVGLFKNFKVTPIIHGAAGRNLHEDLTQKVIVTSDNGNWELIQGDSVAVMGNIAYEIDNYALNISWSSNADDRLLYELLNAGVRLNVGIGDLDIAASREALQYTDDTKSFLINRLKDVIKEIPELLSDRFSHCKTLWEAKVLYKEYFSHGGFGHSIKNIVEKRKGVKWNGIGITNNYFDFTIAKEAKCFLFSKKHGYKDYAKVRGKEQDSLMVDKDVLVIIDDRGTPNGRLNRIAPLIEVYEGDTENSKKYDKVYLISFDTPAAKDAWYKATKFDLDCKKLTDYPSVKLRDIYPSNQTTANSSAVKPAKHQTKEFSFDRDCKKGRWHNCRSDFFTSEAVDIKNDSGVYVEINGFWVLNADGIEKHPHEFSEQISCLEAAGIEVPKIYAFKSAKIDKIEGNSNWTHFKTWATKELTKILDEDISQKIADRRRAKQHFKYCEKQDFHFLMIDGRYDADDDDNRLKYDAYADIVDEDSVLIDYYNKFHEMLHTSEKKKLDSAITAFQVFHVSDDDDDSKVKTTYNLDNLLEICKKRYPLIEHGFDQVGWQYKESIAKEFINYVNLIDVTWKSTNGKTKVKKITNIFDPTIQTLEVTNA